jgi:fumarate hydratase class II
MLIRCALGQMTCTKRLVYIVTAQVNNVEFTAAVRLQVMGNNVAISVSGTHGHFELNVFKVSLLCILMLCW